MEFSFSLITFNALGGPHKYYSDLIMPYHDLCLRVSLTINTHVNELFISFRSVAFVLILSRDLS
jgi:hypothetical protein